MVAERIDAEDFCLGLGADGLAQNAVLASLSPACRRALAETAVPLSVAPGRAIFWAGQPSASCFVLLDGLVALFGHSERGAGMLMQLVLPGRCLGAVHAVAGLDFSLTAEAITPCRVLRLDAAVFRRAVHRTEGASFLLLEEAADQMSAVSRQFQAMAFQDVPTRLANFLWGLVCMLPPSELPRRIPFRLTHEVLAKCIGATERSVSRALRAWFQAGWLARTQRGHYLVLDLEALQREAAVVRAASPA